MDRIIRIAVDGPAGAGKSTVAKLVAKALGIDYIDTGAMYRAVALKLARTGTDYKDGEALAVMLAVTDVDFSGGHVHLDGEDVEGLIRTPEISALASSSSAVLAIREKLVALQRGMGQKKSVIMDGRDIGTNVFTDAEYKFYITASPHVRAVRRARELEQKGQRVDLAQVEADIIERDYNDSHREHNPLKKADDAVEIDTSDMSIEEVVGAMLAVIQADGKGITAANAEPLFVCYPRCSTCRKAKDWLDARGISCELRDIKTDNPTEAELREWHRKSGLPLKRFFNTSGLLYKELGLSQKLKDMPDDEQFRLLASDGMLVKRPILVRGETVLLGFKDAEYERLF